MATKLDEKRLARLAAHAARMDKRIDVVRKAKEQAGKLAAKIKKLKSETAELDK